MFSTYLNNVFIQYIESAVSGILPNTVLPTPVPITSGMSPSILPIEINSSVADIEFWTSPAIIQTLSDTTSLGILCTINLSGCSGLYSAIDVSSGTAWNNNIGGIPLDSGRLRTDIDIGYMGTEADYISRVSTDGGGYQAVLKNSGDLKLSYKNKTILAYADSNGIKKIKLKCWKYNTTGLFNGYVQVYLNFENVEGDVPGTVYSDINYTLSNCALEMSLKNRYGGVISVLSKTVNIAFPTASGFITCDVTKIKNPKDLTFRSYRNVNFNSENFTTLTDVRFVHYDFLKSGITSYWASPKDFTNTLADGASYNVNLYPNIKMKKGDFVQTVYYSKLFGSKGNTGGAKFTHKISCCEDHKFSINNVKIELQGNGIWNDVTSLISSGSLIYYANTSGGDVNLRSTFSLDHEDWERTDLPDYSIYPCVKSMYLMVTNNVSPASKMVDPYGKYPEVLYEAVPISGMELTYPNHTAPYGLLLKRSFIAISGNNPDLVSYITPASNVTSFNAGVYSLAAKLRQPGNFQLYAIVEDEFNQCSCFCITNIKDNYKIPFRRT